MLVTLYTRRNCPLCDKAKAAIRASGATVELEEVDIDGDPELHARYTNDVPVVMVQGREAFRHRFTAEEFGSYVGKLTVDG
jgi:glutaredoxin